MLCVSGFELYSRWVTLTIPKPPKSDGELVQDSKERQHTLPATSPVDFLHC